MFPGRGHVTAGGEMTDLLEQTAAHATGRGAFRHGTARAESHRRRQHSVLRTVNGSVSLRVTAREGEGPRGP